MYCSALHLTHIELNMDFRYLGHNQLTSLPAGVFDGLPSLYDLFARAYYDGHQKDIICLKMNVCTRFCFTFEIHSTGSLPTMS